ncbi:hypothetical protein BU16DRAFT_540549 [Lophium mytilinum]|uniref:Ubiquitin-like protease family profile domain-containing protein n=1 Tax=Lophium mytilinum TaxID=390894 RepID=A0A6A6QNE3_9PEZI|nr:hypothetical protein BU16DRAFT_540549 [Lophium mytilinum]
MAKKKAPKKGTKGKGKAPLPEPEQQEPEQQEPPNERDLTIDGNPVDHSPITGQDTPEAELPEGYRLLQPSRCPISSPLAYKQRNYRPRILGQASDAVQQLWARLADSVIGNERDSAIGRIQGMQEGEAAVYWRDEPEPSKNQDSADASGPTRLPVVVRSHRLIRVNFNVPNSEDASASSAPEPVVLYRLNTRELNQNRRNYGWFLRIAHGDVVRINGVDYTNDRADNVEIVGPLLSFNYIEIADQAVFFWGGSEGAQYQYKRGTQDPTLSAVPQNQSDTAVTNTTITLGEYAVPAQPSGTLKRPQKLELPKSRPPPSDIISPDESPCAFYRSQLGLVKTRLSVKIFKDGKEPRWSKPGAFMRDDEILLSIASLLLLLAQNMDIRSGFNAVSSHVSSILNSIDAIRDPPEGVEFRRALRPGRPMLVPIFLDQHIVLVVIQMGADRSITADVLDSRRHHYTANMRTTIYNRVCNLIQWTKWHIAPSTGSEPAPELPREIFWAPAAQQPNGWGCGYHTVCNAWAIALGLEINEAFQATEDFYRDARELFILATGGNANYRLIYGFLRCHEFVIATSNIPINRQTQGNTVSIASEHELDGVVAEMLADSDDSDVTYASLDRTVNTNFPEGLSHAERFPHDSHDEGMKQHLIDLGIYDPNDDGHDVKRKYWDDLLQDPCSYYRSRVDQIRADIQSAMKNEKKHTYQITNGALGLEDVIGGIASVTEAITSYQQAQNPNDLTPPGFAHATQQMSEMAQIGRGTGMDLAAYRVSRPRQPWLYPYIFSEKPPKGGRAGAHILLYVFQQEGERVGFYRLDSDPNNKATRPENRPRHDRDALRNARDFVTWDQWGNDRLKYPDKQATPIPVPQQPGGTNSCGVHSVLNAWAVALGLEINPSPKKALKCGDVSDQEDARWLVNAALAGAVGWADIYAFLACKDYVVRTSRVPANRQFDHAQRQGATRGRDVELDGYPERIETQRVFDQSLADNGVELVANMENNVDFEKWGSKKRKADDGGEAGPSKKKKKDNKDKNRK